MNKEAEQHPWEEISSDDYGNVVLWCPHCGATASKTAWSQAVTNLRLPQIATEPIYQGGKK